MPPGLGAALRSEIRQSRFLAMCGGSPPWPPRLGGWFHGSSTYTGHCTRTDLESDFMVELHDVYVVLYEGGLQRRCSGSSVERQDGDSDVVSLRSGRPRAV